MTTYLYLILLISLSSAFAYINQRWIKLPFVIGLFLLSTILSVVIISAGNIFDFPIDALSEQLEKIHIDQIILNVLLGFLLLQALFIPTGHL